MSGHEEIVTELKDALPCYCQLDSEVGAVGVCPSCAASGWIERAARERDGAANTLVMVRDALSEILRLDGAEDEAGTSHDPRTIRARFLKVSVEREIARLSADRKDGG